MENEDLMLDINKERDFEAWSERTWVYLGQKTYAGNMVTLYREGYMYDDAFGYEFAGEMTMVAPGTIFRGVVRPQGLTASQARIAYPVAAVTSTVAAKREGYRLDHLKSAGACIACIMSQMKQHTVRFFSNMPEVRRAINTNDLILFVHIVKTQGIIGTGNKADASLKMEMIIANRDESTLLLDKSTNRCDFSDFCMRWTNMRDTLKKLGSNITEGQLARAFINALPDEAIYIKAPLMASPPATLDLAIDYFSRLISNQNIPLDDCGKAFGLKETAKGRNNKRQVSIDEEKPKGGGGTLDDVDINRMVAAMRANYHASGDSETGAAGGGLGSSRDSDDHRDKKGRADDKNKAKDKKGDIRFTECKHWAKNKLCDWEKVHNRACVFMHSGNNAKVNGVIKPIKAKGDAAIKK